MIDDKNFYIDLLFYHRKLRRLVAIDLKLAAFQAADKGQMELYLRWLERHETEPGEERPIGLIPCENMGAEQVELLQLNQSDIRVASYLTDLPPKAVLEKRFKAAAELARKRLRQTSYRPALIPYPASATGCWERESDGSRPVRPSSDGQPDRE